MYLGQWSKVLEPAGCILGGAAFNSTCELLFFLHPVIISLTSLNLPFAASDKRSKFVF
jgi:hypothetical protein